MLTSSMIIYQYKYTCGATYIGRTTRQLSKRVKEHQPNWLRHGGNEAISSAIVEHLVDTGHPAGDPSSFTIIYRMPPNNSRAIRYRMLATAEAISIRLPKPDLCKQRKLVQTLQLPWPSTDYVISANRDSAAQSTAMQPG